MRCPVSGAWGDVGSADGAHHPNRNGVAALRTEPSPTLKRLVAAIVARNNATLAQVALAWILAQHPTIVPIPGTTKLHRLQENTAAADVEFSPADLERSPRPPIGSTSQATGTRHTCNVGSTADSMAPRQDLRIDSPPTTFEGFAHPQMACLATRPAALDL